MTGFDYSDESSAIWPAIFDEHRARGEKVFRAKVGWGAHESLRGVRDFSKSSRLRLEKLLSLAEEREFAIELFIRPVSGPKDFPQWTTERPSRLVVPYALVDETHTGFAQFKTPSLLDPEVREGFISFLADVFLIAMLYRAPDGPLTKIHIDLSSVISAQNLGEYPEFKSALLERYRSLESFNSLYQVSLSSLDHALSEKGLKLAGERRPWNFAFDYKYAVGRVISALQTEIRAVESAKPLQKFITFHGEDPSDDTGADFTLVFESTLLGQVGGRDFPFCPGVRPFMPSAGSYRFSDFLRQKCRETGTAYRLLDELSVEQFRVSTRFLSVVTGKNISGRCFATLKELAQQGHAVFFPAGFPQFDQDLASLEWCGQKRFLGQGSDGKPLAHLYQMGAGGFIAPTKAIATGDGFWQAMQRWMAAVLTPEGVKL